MNPYENDAQILQQWFQDLYSIGADESGGVTRLGYTHTEDVMHGALRNIARNLGLKYSYDEVGNTYIYQADSAQYHLIGSHVDSVINGGRYDGVAGVLAGLLILKWVKEQGLKIPIKVVAFRCEESSVFGISTVGSSLITHKITKEQINSLFDREGRSLHQILKSKSYNPDCQKIQGVLSYFEIHIEQGRILEDSQVDIGVVDSIATATRYWLTIHGRQDHSGATPMNYRKDALCAASEVIVALEQSAQQESHKCSVATVGHIDCFPNSFNVVAGKVKIGVDMRGIDWESIQKMNSSFLSQVDVICSKRNLPYDLHVISNDKPIKLDGQLKKSLQEHAKALGLKSIIMNSGAGHDAMKFYDIAPTAMILIPCKEGISHNPLEDIDIKDLLQGTRVIFNNLKELS